MKQIELSRVQHEVLETLRAIYIEGLALIPDADKRALGGLSEGEKLAMVGVTPDGEFYGNCVCVKSARRIRGASYRTLYALQRKGLVSRKGRTWYSCPSIEALRGFHAQA